MPKQCNHSVEEIMIAGMRIVKSTEGKKNPSKLLEKQRKCI